MRLERYDYRLYEMVARLLTLAHGIQYPRGVEEKVLSAIFPPEQTWAYRPDENVVRVRVEECHGGQPIYQYLLVFEYHRDQTWRWSIIPSPHLYDIYEYALKRLTSSIKTNVCTNPFYYDVDYLAPRTLFEGFMRGIEIVLNSRHISLVRRLFQGERGSLQVGVYEGDSMAVIEEKYDARCNKDTFIWLFSRDSEWTLQVIEKPEPFTDEDPLKKIEKEELYKSALKSAGVKDLTPWIKTF